MFSYPGLLLPNFYEITDDTWIHLNYFAFPVRTGWSQEVHAVTKDGQSDGESGYFVLAIISLRICMSWLPRETDEIRYYL